jgi:hypothetical protein
MIKYSQVLSYTKRSDGFYKLKVKVSKSDGGQEDEIPKSIRILIKGALIPPSPNTYLYNVKGTPEYISSKPTYLFLKWPTKEQLKKGLEELKRGSALIMKILHSLEQSTKVFATDEDVMKIMMPMMREMDEKNPGANGENFEDLSESVKVPDDYCITIHPFVKEFSESGIIYCEEEDVDDEEDVEDGNSSSAAIGLYALGCCCCCCCCLALIIILIIGMSRR